MRSPIPCAVFLAAVLVVGCSKSGDDERSGPTTSTSSAQTPAELLGVVCAEEPREEWTWATTSAVVLRYFLGPAAPSNCVIISELLSPGCCTSPETCSFAGTTFSVQQALQFFGELGSVVTLPLAFDTLKAEIDAGRPVMPVFSNSFDGHVVVIYGYDGQSGEVYLCDPFFGDFVVPYDLTFTYSGGALNWGATVKLVD